MDSEMAAALCGGFLALCSAIVLIGNAAEKIAKGIRTAKTPEAQQNSRIAALETWRIGVDQKLERDKQELEEFHESSRITALALIALLDHSLDGNNIQQMKNAKNELHNYLTAK